MSQVHKPNIEALHDIAAALLRLSPAEYGTDQGHIDELDSVIHMLRPKVPEGLHSRAVAAVERLGLDGAKLELAVAVFGWGSDEANGSLLGLVRLAWGGYDDVQITLVHGDDTPVVVIIPGDDSDWDRWELWTSKTLDDALVLALEARQP